MNRAIETIDRSKAKGFYRMWDSSIVRISGSKEATGTPTFQATGFVYFRDRESTYILTCAHVIRDLFQIQVSNYPNYGYDIETNQVTDIIYNKDSLVNDLAILKVDRELDVPILPLSILGWREHNFSMPGIFKGKESPQYTYRLEWISGKTCGDFQRSTDHEGQVPYWRIHLDEKDLPFQDGHSGAPITSARYVVASGIATNRMQGKGLVGWAIAANALNEIYQQMPDLCQDLPELRTFEPERWHPLEDVQRRLQDVFLKCPGLFPDFVKQNFSSIKEETLSFYRLIGDPQAKLIHKIYALVLYAHETDQIDRLLAALEGALIKCYSMPFRLAIKSGIVSLSDFVLRFGIILGQLNRSSGATDVRVYIHWSKNTPLTLTNMQIVAVSLENGVSEIAGGPASVLEMEGSIVARLQMSSSSLERLINAYEKGNPILKGLGVTNLEEICLGRYHQENVVFLLIELFDLEELKRLALDLFRGSSEWMQHENKTMRFAELMVLRADEESLVDRILAIAKKKNDAIYQKFKPYQVQPRKPDFQQAEPKSRQLIEMWSRIRSFSSVAPAAAIAIVLSTAASALIFLGILSVPENPDIEGNALWLACMMFPSVLGFAIGEFIKNSINRATFKYRPFLAAGCYWMGQGLGLLLAVVMRGELDELGMNFLLAAISALVLIPLFIILNQQPELLGFGAGLFFAFRQAE